MSLNKGSLDQILALLKAKQFKQNETGVNIYSQEQDDDPLVVNNDVRYFLRNGGGSTWVTAGSSFNETNLFISNHDGLAYFENYLKALFSLRIEINAPYFPKSVTHATQNIIFGWWYSIDSGVTWIEVESNEYDGEEDIDVQFAINYVDIPIPSITGDVLVRMSEQGTEASGLVLTGSATIRPKIKMYLVLNTLGE